MSETIKKLKDLGFKANHRWHEIAETVLNNPHHFDTSQTLKQIKDAINKEQKGSEGKQDPPAPAEPAETAGEAQHQQDTPAPSETAAATGDAAPADYVDIDSINSANRARMIAMMGEAGGNGGHGNDTGSEGSAPAAGERKKRVPKDPPKPEYSNMITGYLLLVIMDMLIPSAICFAYNRFTDKGKAKPIDPAKLRMEQKEIKELTPIADEVAKSIGGGMSPLTALLIGYGSMTLGKFMML